MVVDDALEVIPEIERIIRINTDVKKNPRKITPLRSKEMLEVARTLRSNAQTYGMYHAREMSTKLLKNRIKAINSEVGKILENE